MKATLRKIRKSLRLLPWRALALLEPAPAAVLPASLDGKTLLVVQWNALGDALMTTPLLRRLKSACPSVRLEVLCRAASAPIFSANARVDRVHAAGSGGCLAEFGLLRTLRQRRFDVLLDASGLLETACISRYLSPASSVGFSRELPAGFRSLRTDGYYGVTKPYSDSEPIAAMLMTLADGWGGDVRPAPLEFAVEPAAQAAALDMIRLRGVAPDRCVVLHPGGKWPPKRWPVERWVGLVRRFRNGNEGLEPILVGGADDAKLLSRIAGLCPQPAPWVAAGLPVEQLAGLLSVCRAAVADDSFVMHLAAAVGTPVVALFGPVHPARSAPVGAAARILYAALPCSPCTLYYTVDRCRRGLNFCMHRIEPDAVAKALDELTRETKRG